jgi:hypothetical protein
MKKHLLATLVAVLATAFPLHAAERKAGPNGGRLLTNVQPNAEFLVTASRKVKITFIGADGKIVAPAEQVVTVTTGERSAPVKLSFVKNGDALISEQALPAGEDLPAVVQIKTTPDAKAAVEKFHLNLAICSGCKLAEYACTCDHAH